MNNTEEYAETIMCDELSKIAAEKTLVYETHRIERVYEFYDGAIVKYEWQESPSGRTSKAELFNHRFTLVEIPSPNPNKFQKGVIKVINYPQL